MDIRRAVDILAQPRVSEAEAIARALDEGIVMVPLSSDSFMTSGPSGQLLYEGLSIGSESFCNDPLGLLNVTKAWQLIQHIRDFEPRRLPIDERLAGQLRGVDIEQGALDRMTIKRRSMPILLATDSHSAANLIDGAHRLYSRIQHRKTWVHAYILDQRASAFIRARVWRLKDDGTKVEIDTTKGHWSLQVAMREAH